MPDAAMSRYARLLLRVALIAAALGVFTHTRADPDLWGHVRFGEDMIGARTVHVADRYSFASDRPWVNHEWLAEVIMYGSYAAAGSLGLVLLKVMLLALMLAAVLTMLRPAMMTAPMHDLMVGLVVVSTVPQGNHVRPQLFSLVMFAWLLAVLVRARGARWLLLLPAPIMALWVNLHGGWIVGAGTLMAWTATGLVWPTPGGDRRSMVAAAAAAMTATLLNPYGWHLWTFLRETVALSRPDIIDWQPLTSMGFVYVGLWLLVATALAATLWQSAREGRADVQALAMPLLLAAASLRVNRLLSFFAISVVMLIGTQRRSTASQSGAITKAQPSKSTGATGAEGAPRLAVAIVVALTVLTASIVAAARNVACIRMESAMFPEPGVVPVVAKHRLNGRMLTWFDWGQYAIWHWGREGITVSMDGRRETVYSDAVVREHLRFYFDPGQRDTLLRRLSPDYVWLPANLKVTEMLLADGWHPLYSGGRSVLLTRALPTAAPMSETPGPGPRCFPGP